MEGNSGVGQLRGAAYLRGRGYPRPPGKPTMSPAQLGNQDASFVAFNIELIRNKIVKYAMHQDNGTFSPGTACNLRFVGKLWNESVVKILFKSQEPLYKLTLTVQKTLEDFVECFRAAVNLHRPFPPFTLHTRTFCGHHVRVGDNLYNTQHVFNFLTTCGPGLIELFIIIEMDKPSYPKWAEPLQGQQFRPWLPYPFFVFPSTLELSLPHLKKLEMIVKTLQTVSMDDMESTGGLRFTTSLFRGAANSLTDCKISWYPWGNEFVKVQLFQTLVSSLPCMITTLNLEGHFCKDILKLVRECPPPNLTCLTLYVCDVRLDTDELLFGCLDKIRGSLKTLKLVTLDTMRCRSRRGNRTLLRFPVMEALQILKVDSLNVELEEGLYSLEKFFPKLDTLQLLHQTDDMLRKWMTGSQFDSVTTPELVKANERYDYDQLYFLQTLNQETMKRVDIVFPNLRKLTLTASDRDPSGLHYVFMEMGRLTELKLIGISDVAETEWDTLLTGVPLEIITRSNEDDNFWGSNPNFENTTPSLKQLKNLKTFSLTEQSVDFISVALSKFTFQFALYQMPSLENVYVNLQGGPGSDELAEEWTRQGRTLVY